MLLNESDLKTLIKDIIKEVNDEYLGDDMLFFPENEYESLYMPRQNESDLYVKAVRDSLLAIREELGLLSVKPSTRIHAQHTADKSKMEIPSNRTEEVVEIIASVCKSLDESLPDEEKLISKFYNNEVPQGGGSHTLADIVAMFIPREPLQQEKTTGHQHL